MTLDDRVEAFLKASQVYRDSDKRLLLDYWAKEGLVLTKDQRQVFMEKCSVAESITRARRKLKHKYPASKEVDEARFKKYVQYRLNNGVMEAY